MKLLPIYEGILNGVHFKEEPDENDADRITISAIVEGEPVAKIVLQFMVNGYWEFEDRMSEDEYNSLFPEDSYVMVEDLVSHDKGKGYARALLNYAIAYSQKAGQHMIYLNASPKGYEGLGINKLVGFYQSMGFEVIIDDNTNKEMVRRI